MPARRRPTVAQSPLFEAEHVAHTEARENGFVPTPPWVVRTLVEGMARAGHPPLPWGQRRAETAAGGGAIVDAADAIVGPGRWTLTELRQDAIVKLAEKYGSKVEIRRGDYLTIGSGHTGEGLWITNPSFDIAAPYFAKMIAEAAGVGTVALHVPWAFAATDALDGLAVDLYPIEGRPYGFVSETCWIVHGPGRGGRRLLLRKPQ